MGCRTAQPADRPALLELWEQVFGDGPDFAARCLDSFAGPGNVYVAEGEPMAAMLLAAPCTLGGQAGIYLYALATRPQQRATGVMTALMAFAEREKAARGAHFAALIPANAPLFNYYRKRGYNTSINLRHIAVTGVKHAAAHLRVATLSRDGLQAMRAEWLSVKPICFSNEQAEFIAEDMVASGWQLATANGGYAVFNTAAEGLLVAELGAADTPRAEALVGAILRHTAQPTAQLTLPEASPLYPKLGNVRPAALLKPLRPGFEARWPYLRFALDEVADSFSRP